MAKPGDPVIINRPDGPERNEPAAGTDAHSAACVAEQPYSFDWTDCTDTYYVYGSIARGGGGYWPCMVNVVTDDLEGNITADDARRLAAVLIEAADQCDKATKEEFGDA